MIYIVFSADKLHTPESRTPIFATTSKSVLRKFLIGEIKAGRVNYGGEGNPVDSQILWFKGDFDSHIDINGHLGRALVAVFKNGVREHGYPYKFLREN